MSCSVSSDHEREIALADALEPQHNLDRAAGTLAAHLGALPSDLGMLIVQMAATMDYQSAICWTVVSKTFRKWSVRRDHFDRFLIFHLLMVGSTPFSITRSG